MIGRRFRVAAVVLAGVALWPWTWGRAEEMPVLTTDAGPALEIPADANNAQPIARGRERRIKWFHFEEWPRNPNPMPEHWFAIGRPAKTSDPNFYRYPLHQQLATQAGFPQFGNVHFDDHYATSDKHSFYLGLNGGNAGAFLEVGAVGGVEHSDYLITARLRTTSLERAGARIVAYFVDAHGNRIEGSVATSPATQTDGSWQTISVKLLGDFTDVAWIGIQLEVLQPETDPKNPLGQQQLVLREMEGGAWFDDVVVWQLPRLVVRSRSDVNIMRPPQKPQLFMQVLDLTGKPLVAHLDIYDFQMHQVAQTRQMVGAGAPPVWQWSPRLEKYGWYLIDMQVFELEGEDSADREPVARAMSTLLWLPEERLMHPVDATRFGVVAEDLPDEQMRLLGQLLDKSLLDGVVISAWDRHTTLGQLDRRMNQLDELLHSVMSRRRAITLSLNPLPEELARAMDIRGSSALDMFTRPIEQWRAYLAPVLMRQAQRVHHWQVGPIRSAEMFYYKDFNRMISTLEEHMRSMAPEPVLVVPWSIHQARREGLDYPIQYALYVPANVPPSSLGNYLESWGQTEGESGEHKEGQLRDKSDSSQTMLTLEIMPATCLAHRGRINDLVLKMLAAWKHQVYGMQIVQPWTVSSDRDRKLLPDPVLGVFSSVAHRLAGRWVLGELPLEQGLRCLILDGPAGGMLAVWNESADVEHARLDMFLGQEPVAVDIWGNRTPVPQINGKHQLQLGDTPVFIEGIDAQLAMFRAGFSIDPSFIESLQVIHERSITVKNPWSRTISGHVTVIEPETWTIQPKRSHFSIAAGQSMTIPLGVRFPPSEVAGHKRLVARFDFTAERKYVVDLGADVELGLRDVDFDADVSLEKDAKTGRADAVVTALITNNGNKLLSLRLLAMMRDHARQMQPIPGLKPGESVVRRFRFEDVDANNPQAEIRVRLSELAGPAMLNQILPLH